MFKTREQSISELIECAQNLRQQMNNTKKNSILKDGYAIAISDVLSAISRIAGNIEATEKEE